MRATIISSCSALDDEAAAPYCHPRLASADLRVHNEYAGMSDEELKTEIALLEARIKASQTLN